MLCTLDLAFASKAFRNSETKLINIANDKEKIKVCPDPVMDEGVAGFWLTLVDYYSVRKVFPVGTKVVIVSCSFTVSSESPSEAVLQQGECQFQPNLLMV